MRKIWYGVDGYLAVSAWDTAASPPSYRMYQHYTSYYNSVPGDEADCTPFWGRRVAFFMYFGITMSSIFLGIDIDIFRAAGCSAEIGQNTGTLDNSLLFFPRGKPTDAPEPP